MAILPVHQYLGTPLLPCDLSYCNPSISSSVLQPVFGWLSKKRFLNCCICLNFNGWLFYQVIGLVSEWYLLMIFCCSYCNRSCKFHSPTLSFLSDFSANENRRVMSSCCCRWQPGICSWCRLDWGCCIRIQCRPFWTDPFDCALWSPYRIIWIFFCNHFTPL